MEGQPLLGVLRGLILDGEEQASYNADPSGYMQRAGYDDISADDLGEAVGLVADTLPPDVAQAVTTAASSPDGTDVDDDGATGILDRLASIDADDVPPLDVPAPVELAPDEDPTADGWDDADDATSFGDTDFEDDGFDDEGVDDIHVAADDEAPTDDDATGDSHDTGDDMDADTLGEGYDPFAEEAAEPSLAEAEAGGPIDFRDAADVDDDPIDFGEEGVVPDFGSGAEGLDAPPAGMEAGLAAAPPPPEADDDFGSDDFGADATLEGDTTLEDDPFAEDAFAPDEPADDDGASLELDGDEDPGLGFDEGFGD